jgi:opacity protein-like surface antigen
MSRLVILALSVALGVVVAGPALAQARLAGGTEVSASQGAQKPPPGGSAKKPAPAAAKKTDQRPPTVRGVVSVGLTSLASSRSFDAVAGTHSKTTFGLGAEVQNIWKNVFAGVSYSPLSLDGERVFVDSNVVYPLGIPVAISVNSLDVVGGWRFVLKPKGAKPAPPKPGQKPPAKKSLASLTGQAKGAKPQQATAKPAQPPAKASRFVPFVGAGLSMVMYKETSTYSNGEDVNKSASGFVFLGGVDCTLTRWIHVGGEFRYRAVNGVLGSDGVSKLYGEKSVGGYVIAARVAIGK